MGFLVENWFFLVVLLCCVAMHFFGHGHRHGSRHAGSKDDVDRAHGGSTTPERKPLKQGDSRC